MLVRRSVPLLVAGVLAAAGCKDVNQRDPAPLLALATFDPTTGSIPLPNDLALRAAPNLPDGDTKTALLGLIIAGGWPNVLVPEAWGPGITVPIRAEGFVAGTGAYSPTDPPTGIDVATVTDDTVAIVRIDGTPTRVPAAYAGYAAGAQAGTLVLVPTDGTAPLAALQPGRYVVAVRGGDEGVHVLFGDQRVPLEADRPIALVAPNLDLTQPENQPSGGLAPAQIAALESLRASFALPLDWGLVDDETTCRNNVPMQPSTTFPGRCWLPAPSGSITPAFDAVNQYFPHEEIASIQTFELFNAIPSLQDEVTP